MIPSQGRLPRRLGAQRGLTLVELLLSLALMALVTSFVAAGFATTRRGAGSDRAAARAERMDDSLRALGDLVADAVPVALAKDDGHRVVAFDGDGTRLAFVAAGDGLALRGGLWAVRIGEEQGGLTATAAPARDGDRLATGAGRPLGLPSAAERMRLAYFGAASGAAASWSESWTSQARLPRLVRITLSSGAGTATRVVALRRAD